MVVHAVGGKIHVLFDGGVRRGTDISKVGRPVIYGLVAKGEYRVRRVIEMLKDELELTMALSGCPTVNDIIKSLVRTELDGLNCWL
ncbi:Peroxisomal (S)-2-hydroxy-acid oxidase GLO4 [Camellia lanceoleosa]|uniref:Peroxisomal (S)-2-hydroxy-acid oxidase GLO4 n=1 Tax=Camellia lanceoleosa TaxID=1840588 RepID=A0ACC0FFG3_9ERIC|nr:Peroxisomal (S)-2-hydroxy-acid oxidase GLO4 [Camellia lanceoleosa]